MRLKKALHKQWVFIFGGFVIASPAVALGPCSQPLNLPLTQPQIVNQLGWVETGQNRCGGYYLEPPFLFPENLDKNKLIITSDQLLFAQKGTSYGQGKVTITRYGQEVVANRAFIYRDPATGEIKSIELLEDVRLRQPSSLVIAHRGSYDFKTKAESLHDILYRTAIYNDFTFTRPLPSDNELHAPRKIFQLSAWGEAKSFNQDQPEIYEFNCASYSTCPPTHMVWKVKASHIVLNRDTGRGYATNARILFKNIPVFYLPYINFPIDSRRKTGFLWPTVGNKNNYGPYIAAPFYLNMAPNYDMTITPAFLSKRGVQLNDLFRYLSPSTRGALTGEILPDDKAFAQFKKNKQEEFGDSENPVTQSELRRLKDSSLTRKSFNWVNRTRFNDYWNSHVDFNWVSDDYYLRDFSNSLSQITQNQLLQLAELDYNSPHWEFLGRVQAYQTLHPVDDPVKFNNQYRRFPQLILNGNYSDNPGGIEYFIQNETTHFDLIQDPGITIQKPVGNRLFTQPGISRPIYFSFVTVVPRIQFSMTKYELGNVTGNNSKNPSRTLPILDVNSSFYFDKTISFFNHGFRQTLEPQLYYVYIPFRNQRDIPIFDTTVNTLTYDQLFLYNRFSGIDRINDANQITAGITTRFIDQQTGQEKLRAAIGEIFYFRKRSVTLCTNPSDPLCPLNTTDYLDNPDNSRNRSPISGLLNYNVNSNWSLNSNIIINPLTNNLDNGSLLLHFQPPNTQKIINLGYNFVRDGDVLPNQLKSSSSDNLSTTDFSFSWPFFLNDWSVTGRWTENWNHHHFQNLLYGLQYDSCCWAVRFVTGRVFTHLNSNNTSQYTSQFYLQIALKGLGTVPVSGGDPTQLLSSNISGYQSNFGRDF